MTDKINDIVSKMTLEEKARILIGKDVWRTVGYAKYGIPEVYVADGPSGLRKEPDDKAEKSRIKSYPAVAYPTASLSSCSFDRELLREYGEHIAEDCIKHDVDVILGPAINIDRSPMCGRNFEYFSEDPLLAGELSTEYIKGVQSKGVGTCLKHFAANSQEKLRLVGNSVIDERALHEIYLKAFEIAVKKSNPTSIMTSYNRLNGPHIPEDRELNQKYLRGEWGFDGALITDWGALDNIAESYLGGLNLEMPGGEKGTDKIIIEAVKSGKLPEEELDNRVRELLSFVFKVSGKKADIEYKLEDHLKFAEKVVQESVVLLKNEESILPLDKKERVLIVGEFAENPRRQGGGSSCVNMIYQDNIIKAFENGGYNHTYIKGFTTETTERDEEILNEVLNVAGNYDKVVIFAGLPLSIESESFDRTVLEMPLHIERAIKEITKKNKNIVVLINAGSPVSMDWRDSVKGIIYTGLIGCNGGKAVVDILYGAVNPSGKLSQTFPIKLEDTPCYHNFADERFDVLYMESIFVGYRYYLSAKKEVLFPFGHGLSYTNFDIKLETYDNERIVCKIKNTGKTAGKEVIQLYKSKSDSFIPRPAKELIYFEKVGLEAGEEKTIEILLKDEMFEYFDKNTSKYKIEDGEYILHVGNSSVNDSFTVKVIRKGEKIQKEESAYFNVTDNNFDFAEFEKLYGKKIELYKFKLPYTQSSTMGELRQGKYGIDVYNKLAVTDSARSEMALKALQDWPLRIFARPERKRNIIEAYLLYANGEIDKANKMLASESEENRLSE